MILHLECASLLTDSINVVQVADLPVREDIAEKTKDAQVIQTPKLYLSLAEVPPASPNVGFIEVLQFNGVSTDKSVKELEYEVRVLTSKSKQLMEEKRRLEEITEERRRERETQNTEREALQIRLLKMQVAEKDIEACKRRRREEKFSEMAIEPEKAGQTPPTVQTRVVPEIQMQNQQRRGRGFRFEGCYCCSQMGHWSRDCPHHRMLQVPEHCTKQRPFTKLPQGRFP